MGDVAFGIQQLVDQLVAFVGVFILKESLRFGAGRDAACGGQVNATNELLVTDRPVGLDLLLPQQLVDEFVDLLRLGGGVLDCGPGRD